MKPPLIVFGEDWGGLPSSTQHLIEHLAQARKVIWVNSIGLRRPRLNRHDILRAWHKLWPRKASSPQQHLKSSLPASDNFFLVNPLTLPAPRSRVARWLATRLLLKQLRPLLRSQQITAPLLWISLPTAVDFIGHLEESAVIYYCGDDFSALAGVDHDTVAAREEALVARADLILCASQRLVAKFPCAPTRLLNHGVDLALFAKPSPRALDLPDDGRPIAGFYGSISHWLNLDLLCTVIKQLPEWHFIFIGKIVVDVSALAGLDNVRFLGERPHRQLPSYCQHWNASLLPFIDNSQIRACNPLKLVEYLACGRPIVTTNFPALQAYRGLVQIADQAPAMIEALQASRQLHDLAGFSPATRQTVADKDWASQAQLTAQWLDAL
ncbi:glycosyl transferase [Gammaproteobacteria bacterium 53_120_T64]|nr:glycosyl transferase [Gammaproteobacteria bacterium 53_120_T64]